LEFVQARKDELANKIVVDISNPVDFKTLKLIPPAGISGAELIAQELSKETKFIKAFNTTSAGTLVAGQVDGKILDVFMAGDDQDAKDILKDIINESGMRAFDAGPLAHARYLEGFSLIHIVIQEQLGTNFMSAIKILS
jgi:8-hydroxy-5-deazaflavin:NADPH oxidoreductase